MIGPILPALAHQTGSPLSAVGALISTLFTGALLAQIIGGPLCDRYGSRPLLLVGLGCLIAGVATIALSPVLAVTLAGGVLAGLGHGALDIGTSVMIASAYPDSGVVTLNMINVFFGIGAVSGPLLAGLALHWWGTPLPALWLTAGTALGLAPFVFRAHPSRPSATNAPRATPRLWGSLTLWGLAVTFLCYVGLENSVGGWIALMFERSAAQPAVAGDALASLFWLALTVGRVVVTVVGSRFAAWTVLLFSLGGVVVGMVGVALGIGVVWLTVAAIAILGFSCGPIFPTGLAITTALFSASPGRAAGVVITAGSVGGIIMPWVTGLLLLGLGSLAAALALVAVAAAMLLSQAAGRPRRA